MIKSKFKRVTSLFLATLMCVTTFAGIGSTTAYAASGEKADVYMVDFPRDGDANYDGVWGHSNLTLKNGWHTGRSNFTNLKAIGSYSGNVAYCIEPGISLKVGQTMNKYDENYFNNLAANGVISGDEIRLFVGRILQYGYRGTISTSWRSQNEAAANSIAQAYATQLLIWETVIGERDTNFNHVEDNLVEGVKFHLFGTSLSGDAVDQYAVTDKNGVATFKDVLISGSEPYTLEEVDTAIRYVVPKNQTAPVKWKEVTTRNFNNILKKFTVTVTKSDAEKGEAQGNAKLSGAVYGIYKGETLVDKYVTDENGQFTTKEYVCDTDWTIREITPSEGYLLDKTIHEVGADPKLYEVEHNLTSNDVTEQVIKGNVAIIKHTDDGETKIETPEKGASFEIYLKSAGSYDAANKDERDTIVCDENGFGRTKDMPYGIYTVHQTSGWEGREMMDDFDVFISQNAQTYRYLINNRNFESFVNVVKVDAESGKSIPYAGAGFKIYDPQGNQVKMTFTYPTPTTIDVFYTDANGSLVTPEKLDYGKGYSIVEVQAPYGYVLDDTPVYFDITEENSTEEGGVTFL